MPSSGLGLDDGGCGAVLGGGVGWKDEEEGEEAAMCRGVAWSRSSPRLGGKFDAPGEPTGMPLGPPPAPEVERERANVSRLLERRVPRLLSTSPMFCLRGLVSGRKDEGKEAA